MMRLEINADENFLCTSSSRAKQVDALARALHTEAFRVLQGIFDQRLLVKNESFSYDLLFIILIDACEL